MCQNLDLWFLHFIAFCQVFFPAPFLLFWLSVLLSFLLFFIWFFIALCFPPYSSLLFCTCFFFFAHVVSSLAYPNLLENKMLGCCCWTKQERNYKASGGREVGQGGNPQQDSISIFLIQSVQLVLMVLSFHCILRTRNTIAISSCSFICKSNQVARNAPLSNFIAPQESPNTEQLKVNYPPAISGCIRCQCNHVEWFFLQKA
jgi:hypothetical protein